MEGYNEIIKRCELQNIDISDCDIYIFPNSLNGESCLRGTVSKDNKWICIPEREYVPEVDNYTYVPVCHEIKSKFTTYLKGDSINYLTTIYLLYKVDVTV